MPPTTETAGTPGPTDGFTTAERAAMKQRAAELRAEGKAGAKKADGLSAVLERIAEMTTDDRMLAERVHVTVLAAAPNLTPRTWYGMPAYANHAGKIILFFQNSGKFDNRYSTLGFNDNATLDEGDMWPTAYAITTWNPAVERRVSELVAAACRYLNPAQERPAGCLDRPDNPDIPG